MDSPQLLCQFHTVERSHKDAGRVDESNSESHAKDGQQQSLDNNTLSDQCSSLIDCVETC